MLQQFFVEKKTKMIANLFAHKRMQSFVSIFCVTRDGFPVIENSTSKLPGDFGGIFVR